MPLKNKDVGESMNKRRMRLRDLVVKSEQMLLSHKSKNPLLSSIFEKLKNTGYDEKFLEVAQQHAKVMETVILGNKKEIGHLKFVSGEECLLYYIAKVFFDKMILYENLKRPVKINFDNPISILPIQSFLKEDDKARLKFEKTIKAYDLLYVEVLGTALMQKFDDGVEHVEMRIIGRVNLKDERDNELVYHLNSHAFMFKELELTRLGKTEFSASEILKVSVLGKTKVSSRIFVTTNVTALRIPSSEKKSIVLGVVSPKDVPFDLNSFKIASNFQSYAKYLRSLPSFFQSICLKNEIASIGVDLNRIYSFYPIHDGMTIPPNKSVASLYENAKVATYSEAPVHLDKAKKFIENDDYNSATQAFEDSLKCWPESYQVYEQRGKMYHDMCKKKLRRGSFLKKSIIDFETALKLNPSCQEPKKRLSEIFLYLSIRLINDKKYDNAAKLVQAALKLVPDNKDARAMMKKIEKKKSLPILVDDLDLTTLQMRKKLIQKQLKKEIIN